MNKSAKKMFEELGYKVFDDSKYPIKRYLKKIFIGETCYIEFDLEDKTVRSFVRSDTPFTPDRDARIDLKKLQAINQQCKELRWLDD